MRFFLLSPGDIFVATDEIFSGASWQPIHEMLVGKKSHERSRPVRREITRHQILKLVIESNLESPVAMSNPEFL